ncbi:hypothetical protein [Acinetobacter sp. TGL-Y2]|uniref:hypothetical protein n=1 Tax=Acinetobacter sp. TGL-Y2 TaxID=1407071 RepID=UPI0012374BC0|nr:hypothetical protein [Acinetobacter sp. TGL-Y2]
MNNNQIDEQILNKLFNAELRNKVSNPITPVHIENDNESLIGYSVIRSVESIDIDEISYGKQLIEISDSIEKAMYLNKNNTLDFSKKYPKILKTLVEEINASYSLARVMLLSNNLSEQYNTIKGLSDDITIKLDLLKKEIVKIQPVIDEYSGNTSPAIKMRVGLLEQFQSFQNLRIKSIESNLEASASTLVNCTNFLSFTLPNLTYALQSKLYKTNLSDSLKQYKVAMEDFGKIKVRNSFKLKLLISLLFGGMGYIFIYWLAGFGKDIIFIAGGLFYSSLIALVIAIFVCFPAYDELKISINKGSGSLQKAMDEGDDISIMIGLFILGYALFGIVISSIDIFINDLSVLKNSTLTFALCLSSILITLIPFSYKMLNKNRKDSSEFDGIVKQLSELENKYNDDKATNAESDDYRDKMKSRRPYKL